MERDLPSVLSIYPRIFLRVFTVYRLLFIIYLFISSQTLHKMYCHVQREQDNKAQIAGTNSCPLSLNLSRVSFFVLLCPRP